MKRRLVPAFALLLGMLLVQMPGHAASTITVSSVQNDTIEPILVKSDAQVTLAPFRSAALGEANIKSFTLSASGGFVTATINTAAKLPSTNLEAATFNQIYTGVHVMVMFKTENQEEPSVVGCAVPYTPPATCTLDADWQEAYGVDNQYLALNWGVVGNETDGPVSALAVYDPTGRIAGPVFGGQVWASLGQSVMPACPDSLVSTSPYYGPLPGNVGNNTSWSLSNGNQTVTIKTPYNAVWRTRTCAGRSKTMVDIGDDIKDAVAFSWLDHTITGPEVGLIFGWTWYTDSVPDVNTAGGYKVGTPAGDPNPAAVARQNCSIFVQGQQVNPLFDHKPCMTPNPIGPGFSASGKNIVAA